MSVHTFDTEAGINFLIHGPWSVLLPLRMKCANFPLLGMWASSRGLAYSTGLGSIPAQWSNHPRVPYIFHHQVP